MSVLLDELLELFHIGHAPYHREDIKLTDLANEVAEFVNSITQKPEVKIEFEQNLPLVYGDRRRLREVLQILIGNAIKFSTGKRVQHINIGSRKQGNEVIIFVEDNGIGIDPNYHQRVFRLFERLNPSIEGSGVGLTLAHRILEQHGGRVWVESKENGSGSTFYFTIPRQELHQSPV